MVPDRLTLHLEGPDGAGGAVGRDPAGRATFVEGGLPGEDVVVEVVSARDRYARARIVEIVTPAAGRVPPPCPMVAAGCGGCDLQHATPALQRTMKEQVVVDAFVRIGGLDPPAVRTRVLPVGGHRTTVRAAVLDGRAGFRRRRSQEVVVPLECGVVHPLVAEVMAEGRFPGVGEVTIRAGAATGERLVVVEGDPRGVSVPPGVTVAARRRRHGRTVLRPADAAVHEVVAGRRWRISARSFFQSRPDGAEALVEAVAGALAAPVGHLVDLYAGVGLFAGSIGASEVTAVERSHSSGRDARHNLRGLAATVVTAPVERWAPVPADAVVADPARRGLGPKGVAAVVGTGAPRLALVSCDAGSLGRDAALLAEAGYRATSVTLVDLFPHTHHLEVVTGFVRPAGLS